MQPNSRRSTRDADIRLAMALLCGISETDATGRLPQYRFLSRSTKPTEQQGRKALSRLLQSGSVPKVVLWALAAVIAPDGNSPMVQWNQRRVIFKNFNQGHSNPDRDWEIAYWVDEMRRGGVSYEDATANVADRANLSAEQVRRICGKVKLGFDPPPRARRKSPRKR